MKTALFLLYNTNNIQREHRNLKKKQKKQQTNKPESQSSVENR